MSNPIKLNAGVGGGGFTVTTDTVPTAPQGATSIKRISQIMLGIAGVLVLVGGLGFFLLNSRIQKAQAAESSKEAEVGNGQQIAKKFDATMTDYNSTQAQLGHLEASTAPNAYVPTLLPQIQKLAVSNGCQVSAIKPGPIGGTATGASPATPAPSSSSAPADGTAPTSAPAKPPYQTMSLSVTLTGSYAEVMHFVYSLTQFPKIVSVSSIALHPDSVTAPTPGKAITNQTLSADIELQAYVFSSDPVVTTASSATTKTAASTNSGASTGLASVSQAVDRPVTAALQIQAQSGARVKAAGLQAQPASSTMPLNVKLGRS